MLIALIVLVIGLFVAAEIPAVQIRFAQSVAATLEEQLGAEVEIGKLEFSLFDRVVLKDVTLYDKSEREMLKGKHLAVRLSLMDLAMGQVTLHAVELLDVEAHLYKRKAHEAPNFQFVIDAFASKDTTEKKPIDLRINSIIIRRLAISYDEYYKPERVDKGLDPAHLRLSEVYANVSLKALREDSVHLRLRELRFKEKSGLDVQRLRGKVVLGAHQGCVSQLDVALPHSHLTIDTFSLAYDAPLKINLNTLHKADVRLSSARIAPKDLACILPALRGVEKQYDLLADVALTPKHLRLNNFQLNNDARSVRVALHGEVIDWRDSTKRVAHAEVEELYASASVVNEWYRTLTRKDLPALAKRLGSVGYRGKLSAFRSNYHTNGELETAAGLLRVDASLHNGENYAAKLESKGLDVKLITAYDLIGKAAFAVESTGRLVKGEEQIKLKGSLPWVDLKGYRYEQVEVDALWQPKAVEGSLAVNDPNLRLKLQGKVEGLNEVSKRVVADVDLLHSHPQALGLNDKTIGNANVSMRLSAKGQGSTINDMIGQLRVHDVQVQQKDKAYRLANFELTAFYDKMRKHVIEVNSDFLRARLRGQIALGELPKAFMNVVGKHVPSLQFGPNSKASNDFVITAKVLRTEELERFVNLPIKFLSAVDVHAILNEREKSLSLSVVGDSLVVAGERLKQVRVFCKNYDDKTQLLAQAVRTTSKGGLRIITEVEGKNDHLNATLSWKDEQQAKYSGSINAVANVINRQPNERTWVVSVLPSAMHLGDSVWRINPAAIVANKSRVEVDSLYLYNGVQSVLLHGVYGSHMEDELLARVQGLDLTYLFDLLNFHAVDFSGRANVAATVKQIDGKPALKGKVSVNGFTFNDVAMGELSADAVWNNAEKQIDFDADIIKTPQERTTVSGYVSPAKDGLDLMIRAEQTPVGFLGYYLSSIFQELEGKATGWTRLYGKFSDLNLEGEQVVDITVKVPVLGTTYAIHNDTIRLSAGSVEFSGITLHDKYGNTADVSGTVKHDYLRNMRYDFRMHTNRFLCYDTQHAKGELFYGIVLGGGKAHLYGQPGVTRIDANIEAQKGTRFTYNASRPAEVSGQQLLSFRDRMAVAHTHRVEQKEAHSEASDLHMDFNIEALPEAELHIIMDEKAGDNIVFHGNGQLRASYYNKDQFRLFGTYHIVDGLYRMSIKDLIRKDFRFKEGSHLVFRGPTSEGELNLYASYQLPSVSLSDLSQSQTLRTNNVPVECLLNITGRVERPQVAFDLKLPTLSVDDNRLVQQMINTEEERNRQVIYLLSFGRFYAFDGATKRADVPSQDASLTAMNGFLSSTLSAQVNDMLGQALNLRNVSLGTNISTGNDGWNNLEVDGLLSGRFFNNRLVLDAVVGYRENALYNPDASNFVGDFSLRWLLNRNGTLSLKAYSETNDRYFIRSSLTTQGVGVMATKEFTTLSELFRWKNRKSKLDSNNSLSDSVEQRGNK